MRTLKIKWHRFWMKHHSNASADLYNNLPSAYAVYESMQSGWIGFHESSFEYHRRRLNEID